MDFQIDSKHEEVENDDADATGDNDTDSMYQDGNETEGVDKNVSIFEGYVFKFF